MITLPTLIFGGASVNSTESFKNANEVSELFKALKEDGITTIDTAQIYGDSETLLGRSSVASGFIVDTKHSGGFVPGSSSRKEVYERGLASVEKLGVEKINIFYIHAPDPKVPLKETLAGIDDLYRAGKFTTFGLSNFNAQEIKDVIRITTENNFILPKAYQGNYNAISRNTEHEIFPVLREHGIAIYAYSPIAGGFLTKTRAQLTERLEGRWDPNGLIGSIYHRLYNKPSFLQALDEWNDISETFGVPKPELAYRWIAFHSALDAGLGDGLVIGSSSLAQLRQTVAALKKGPLPEEAVKRVEAIWELVRNDSVTNNYDILKSN